jgi:hypothetical protein
LSPVTATSAILSVVFDGIDNRTPKYSIGGISFIMSAPGSYVDPDERERRLRELAKRLGDAEQVEPDTVSQTNREYTNIKQDLTQEFLKFMKISKECVKWIMPY